MSGIGKKIADGARKAAGQAAKASARAAKSAAKQAGKTVVDKSPDFETSSKWLIRVVTSLPKYLRLYFCLLTDNRVSHKAKVVLVTAIAALGAHLAFGGILYNIQVILGYLLGPFTFIPTILILLLTLDICYTLISSDVLEEHQKTIFGEDNSLEADVARLRNFLGTSYDRFKAWWQKKADRAESKMEEQGLIVEGELTDDAIQDVSDQIVELETSDSLRNQMDQQVKLLEAGDGAAKDALAQVEKKLLQE